MQPHAHNILISPTMVWFSFLFSIIFSTYLLQMKGLLLIPYGRKIKIVQADTTIYIFFFSIHLLNQGQNLFYCLTWSDMSVAWPIYTYIQLKQKQLSIKHVCLFFLNIISNGIAVNSVYSPK